MVPAGVCKPCGGQPPEGFWDLLDVSLAGCQPSSKERSCLKGVRNVGHLMSSSGLGAGEEAFLADGTKCKVLNVLSIPLSLSFSQKQFIN